MVPANQMMNLSQHNCDEKSHHNLAIRNLAWNDELTSEEAENDYV